MSSNVQVLRDRAKSNLPEPTADLGAGFTTANVKGSHPAGPVKHGPVKQYLLMLAMGIYVTTGCISLHSMQYVVLPLYWLNRGYYDACISFTKQGFGLMLNTLTEWFTPTIMRISGDMSVRGQLTQSKDGRLITHFPERLILIANHQIYTDWLFMWWVSYTSRMHGHIYIILKESLKYIPIVGPGMIFYGFIFLARNWAKDQPRFARGIKNLNSAHGGPMSGKQALDPMWLLIFPEGTNLSSNGRAASKKWAEKTGLKDLRHLLLPRSTGMHFCLQGLKDVDWVYDCTIGYDGVPRGEYGQDIYSLRSIYFQGRAPRTVDMYWRRFATASIPQEDKAFEKWLRERWIEKDELLEQYVSTGRFPSNEDAPDGVPNYIETEVKQVSQFEFLLIFVPAVGMLAVAWLFRAVFR